MTMYEQYQDTLTDALWSDIVRGDDRREVLTNPNAVAVLGDTYRHRKALAAMGGRWNAARKFWEVPASQIDAVRKLRGVEVA